MSCGAPPVAVPVTAGSLACWASGGGDPVVLLHGFSLDHSMWEPQVPALAARHRVISYDLRGFGRSSPPAAGRSHLDDLVEVLDHLALGRADLVGLSLGANVALAAAVHQPERVRRLVLLSSGLPGSTWAGRPPDEAAEVARRDGVEAARRFWLAHDLFASARARPAAAAALEAMVAAYPAHQWGGGPAMDPLPAVEERLGEVGAPALVLTGQEDLEGYRRIGGLLAARLPRVAHVELAGVGHLLNLEDPDRVNAELRAFLEAETEAAPRG